MGEDIKWDEQTKDEKKLDIYIYIYIPLRSQDKKDKEHDQVYLTEKICHHPLNTRPRKRHISCVELFNTITHLFVVCGSLI